VAEVDRQEVMTEGEVEGMVEEVEEEGEMEEEEEIVGEGEEEKEGVVGEVKVEEEDRAIIFHNTIHHDNHPQHTSILCNHLLCSRRSTQFFLSIIIEIKINKKYKN
jgi:hypothetical protein